MLWTSETAQTLLINLTLILVISYTNACVWRYSATDLT